MKKSGWPMTAHTLCYVTLLAVPVCLTPAPIAADTNTPPTLDESVAILEGDFLVEEVDKNVWEIRSRAPKEARFEVILTRDGRVYVDGEPLNVFELQDRLGNATAELLVALAYAGYHRQAIDPLDVGSDGERNPQKDRDLFVILGTVLLAAGGWLFFFVTRRQGRRRSG
jgi:hypothetical protein